MNDDFKVEIIVVVSKGDLHTRRIFSPSDMLLLSGPSPSCHYFLTREIERMKEEIYESFGFDAQDLK